jgi:uncharacterized protein
MQSIERRYIKHTEVRVADGDSLEIVGYAATFNSPSTDSNLGFTEVCMPGCFARSIRERADVRCLFNHDSNRVLGRVKNGTLQVREDSRGLQYRCQLDPNNSDHRNLHASIKRGDIDECSFGFIAQQQSWSDARDAQGNVYALRKLLDVDVLDVSPVTYPAYGSTTVAARAMFEGEVPQRIQAECRARGIKCPSLVPEVVAVPDTREGRKGLFRIVLGQ